MAIFLCIEIYLIYFYFSEQQKTKDRVGSILLVPGRCLKNNRKMIKNFETLVDYHNVKWLELSLSIRVKQQLF